MELDQAFSGMLVSLQHGQAQMRQVAGAYLELLEPWMSTEHWVALVEREDPERAEAIRSLLAEREATLKAGKQKRWWEQEGARTLWEVDDPSDTILSGVRTDAKTFEDFDDPRAQYPSVMDAQAQVKAWVLQRGLEILTLTGAPGTGKTHLCQAAAMELLRRGERVFLRTEADLVSEAQARFGSHDSDVLIDTICQCGWLILDDLGAGALGEWGKGLMDRIVNNRYQLAQQKEGRTLFSTNLRASDMPARMASRLQEEPIAKIVEIRAPDYRIKEIPHG